jgi:hypothetical protein
VRALLGRRHGDGRRIGRIYDQETGDKRQCFGLRGTPRGEIGLELSKSCAGVVLRCNAALSLKELDVRVKRGVGERGVALQAELLELGLARDLAQDMGEPRLPDAGLAHDVDRAPRTEGGFAEHLEQQVALSVAVDERRVGEFEAARETGTRLAEAGDDESLDRIGEALERLRPE